MSYFLHNMWQKALGWNMYYPLKMVANIPMSAVPPSVGVNHAPAEKLPDDSAEKGG